jgi:hypothetical protein
MLVSEQAPLPVVTHIGIQGLAGYLIPTFMLLCGVLLWLIPIAWLYHSRLAILLALGSWITSNLGGFFIGMLIGVIGGALAFAWTTDADYGPSGWLHNKPRLGLPSWALDVISRLKERAAPQSEGRGPRIGIHLARLHRVGAQAAAAVGALARKLLAWARVIPRLVPLKLDRSRGRTRDTNDRRLRLRRSNRQSLAPWHWKMESGSAAEQRRPTEQRRES